MNDPKPTALQLSRALVHLSSELSASEVIEELGLAPHPEGGWFRETFRSTDEVQGRAASTAILFMLAAGERSHWHRVDADEHWLFHAGDPLELTMIDQDRWCTINLGVAAGCQPQQAIPAGAWQAARPLGRWTLVGCVVAPGFEFAGFELAPPGWEPPGRPDASDPG